MPNATPGLFPTRRLEIVGAGLSNPMDGKDDVFGCELSPSMGDSSSSVCDCKVGRAIDAYDLDELDDTLRTERENHDRSLRDLADLINRKILSATVNRIAPAEQPIVYEGISEDEALEKLYDVIRGNVSASDKARVETRLKQTGVDIESVADDWVTHPTVRRHLNECLGVRTDRTSGISVEKGVNTIEWSRNRTENIVIDTIDRMENAGVLEHSKEVDVHVAVRITCHQCGNFYQVSEYIDSGGCFCDE